MPLPPRTRNLLVALVALVIVGGGAVVAVELMSPEVAPPGGPIGGPGLTKGALGVRLVRVAGGFRQLTDLQFVASSPASPPWLVALEKTGTARIARFDRDAAERAPISGAPVFLTVPVNSGSEMGLLGLAFHPDFAKNGRFFIHINPAGDALRSRIEEWRIDPAKMGEEAPLRVRTVLEVEQPFGNHKGGQIAFGPDRMLFVGLGDGGSGGDPRGNGQNLTTLLGKMLRLDVERADDAHPYAIPPDNPFVGRGDARPEIWAYGLRNPWRFSFDDRGRLVVADVGQNLWEEVDLVERGANLGWNTREGRHCFASPGCSQGSLVDPVWEYGHGVGKSITGGYTYLGSRAPSLRGKWLCGDFVMRKIWGLDLPDTSKGEATAVDVGQSELVLSTFGRAPDGEVYVGDFASGNVHGFASAR